jgi:hypothetical protein
VGQAPRCYLQAVVKLSLHLALQSTWTGNSPYCHVILMSPGYATGSARGSRPGFRRGGVRDRFRRRGSSRPVSARAGIPVPAPRFGHSRPPVGGCSRDRGPHTGRSVAAGSRILLTPPLSPGPGAGRGPCLNCQAAPGAAKRLRPTRKSTINRSGLNDPVLLTSELSRDSE